MSTVILKNEIVTPDRINILTDMINEELTYLKEAFTQNRNNEVATNNIVRLQTKLQDLLKKLFEKKGIVTPDETNEVIDAVNEAKKRKMENDYASSQANLGFMALVGIIVLALFIVNLTKKKNG